MPSRGVIIVGEANVQWQKYFKFTPPRFLKMNWLMARDRTSGEDGDDLVKQQRIDANGRA